MFPFVANIGLLAFTHANLKGWEEEGLRPNSTWRPIIYLAIENTRVKVNPKHLMQITRKLKQGTSFEKRLSLLGYPLCLFCSCR